jgi:hypothetical protein
MQVRGRRDTARPCSTGLGANLGDSDLLEVGEERDAELRLPDDALALSDLDHGPAA